MPHDQAYFQAEKKIEVARRSGARELDLRVLEWTEPKGHQLTELPKSLAQLTELQVLNLSNNLLATLPEWLGQLTQLQSLDLSYNQLMILPESLGQLTNLQSLNLYHNSLVELPNSLGNLGRLGLPYDDIVPLSHPGPEGEILYKDPFNGHRGNPGLELSVNKLRTIPETLGYLTELVSLDLSYNQLIELPDTIGLLFKLDNFNLSHNQLRDLPSSFERFTLVKIDLYNNPFNPELAEAYKQGIVGVKAYLRAKAASQIILNEAKLILIGDGEVGKTCLMDALLGDKWQEHPSTHGIEIKPIKLTDPDTQTEITFNGWDFGGQRVYRPTHQLFFSAPAVYLVVWKPREGPQQGFSSRSGSNWSSTASQTRRFWSSPRTAVRGCASPILTVRNFGISSAGKPSPTSSL